jgi:hypothetical protein
VPKTAAGPTSTDTNAFIENLLRFCCFFLKVLFFTFALLLLEEEDEEDEKDE